jgi:hypothetical protein
MLSKLVASIVAGVLALLTLAAAGWWLYFKPKIIETLGGLPSNAVVAFDISTGCPKGWKFYDKAASRVIVGATKDQQAPPNFDQAGKQLSARPYQAIGGEEKHTITLDEMPPHSHTAQGYAGPDAGRTGHGDGLFHAVDGRTGVEGKGEPFNLLPPFVALYYCARDDD